MASIEAAATSREDGRLARSARTRRAIVDALRALHQEGDLRPTAPRVAERAGVSLRTVFQHFSDVETLLVEAGQRDYEIARGYVAVVDPRLPLDERVTLLVDQRVRMFEDLSPVWRAARLHEPFSPQIRSNRDRLLQLGRDQLQAVFATELGTAEGGRDAAVAALQVATTWVTWEFLRSELHLDTAAAATAVALLVRRVPTPAAQAPYRPRAARPAARSDRSR